MLSPTLFNVFIDDLLQKLHKMNTIVRLGCQHFGSFAYADDVNIRNILHTRNQKLSFLLKGV